MSGTVRGALATAPARLAGGGVRDASRDARLLMAGALGEPLARLTLIAEDQAARLAALEDEFA